MSPAMLRKKVVVIITSIFFHLIFNLNENKK